MNSNGDTYVVFRIIELKNVVVNKLQYVATTGEMVGLNRSEEPPYPGRQHAMDGHRPPLLQLQVTAFCYYIVLNSYVSLA